MAGVLEGIRVLDFGRYIAGPFCGTMLGDLGAEVIRIEKLEGSEDRWVTPVADRGEGAMFLQMGRNKLSLTLNPTKPAGREIVKKLVALSDVVIANLLQCRRLTPSRPLCGAVCDRACRRHTRQSISGRYGDFVCRRR
jgi:crotonobetainyl-CoA:carnitine CoA-transferase CaiB-like acyl-CoA transferase